MRNRKRIALVIAAAVPALLIVAPLFIPTDSIRHAVEARVGEATGLRASIGELSLRLLPVPGLSVRGVRLADVTDGVPLVRVADGRLSVAWLPLLSGEVVLEGVALDSIEVRTSEAVKGAGVHRLKVDRVGGEVSLSTDAVRARDWEARLYGGTVRLAATLVADGKEGRRLEGTLHTAGVAVRPLLRDVAGQGHVAGRLSSELTFSARGPDGEAMRQSLRIDGPVRLADGTLEGIGLEGVAVALVHGRVSRGPIGYEEMSLALRVRGKEVELNDIRLRSSAFDAEGEVRIGADRSLSGEIVTSGTGRLSGAKLLVGGTLETPRVYPAPSSLVGGTLGGAVGGPAGAAIGSRVGGAVGSAVEGVGGAIGGILGGDGKEKGE